MQAMYAYARHLRACCACLYTLRSCRSLHTIQSLQRVHNIRDVGFDEFCEVASDVSNRDVQRLLHLNEPISVRYLICREQVLLLSHLCERVRIHHVLLRHHRRRVQHQAVIQGAHRLLRLRLVLSVGAHVVRVNRVLLLGGIIETDIHAWVDRPGQHSAVVVRGAHLAAEGSVSYGRGSGR